MALLLLASSAVPGRAGAGETPDAVAVYQEGVDLAKEGKFTEAIPLFEKAQEMGAPPVALYNIGKCYEALGKYDLAVEFYTRYAGSPGVEDAEEVEKIIKSLRKKPSLVSISTTPPGAKVLESIDKGSQLNLGTTPVEFSAGAGEHDYEIVLEGYKTKEITVVAGLGKAFDLTVELSPDLLGSGGDGGGAKDGGGGAAPGPDLLGITLEVGGAAVLHPYPRTGFQAGGDATVEAGYRFVHGVATGFSLGLRLDFRPYGLHGRDLVTWDEVEPGSLFTHILLVPGFQINFHPRLGLEATMPLGVAVLAPTEHVDRSMDLDLLGGYIHGGGLVLFDIGIGASLRVLLYKSLFLEIEPVRLHVLIPVDKWESGTKALCDIDMAVRIGWEF